MQDTMKSQARFVTDHISKLLEEDPVQIRLLPTHDEALLDTPGPGPINAGYAPCLCLECGQGLPSWPQLMAHISPARPDYFRYYNGQPRRWPHNEPRPFVMRFVRDEQIEGLLFEICEPDGAHRKYFRA